MKMKAVVYTGPRKVEIQEWEKPVIEAADQVIVKIHSVGICGSDIHNLMNEKGTFPRIPGHEFVGTIEEMGEGVTGWNIGDRVSVIPIVTCGECYACRHGRNNICRKLLCAGSQMDGAFCEYFRTTADKLNLIPDTLTWHQAALTEPYTIGTEVNDRANTQPGDIMLVHGAGPIGIIVMDVARKLGAKVIISEIKDSRLEMAKQMGADWTVNPMKEDLVAKVREICGEEGPNIIVDAAGVASMLSQAVELVSPAGTIVNMCFNDRLIETSLLPFILKEINLVGSRLQVGKFPVVLNEYQDNLKKAEKYMLTHVFTADRGVEAFELALSGAEGVGKIVVDFA